MAMLLTDVEAMTKRFTDYEKRIQELEEELARERQDSALFLYALGTRDQEVFKLCDSGRRLHEAIMSPDSPLKFVHAELAEPLDDLMAAIRVAEPSG